MRRLLLDADGQTNNVQAREVQSGDCSGNLGRNPKGVWQAVVPRAVTRVSWRAPFAARDHDAGSPRLAAGLELGPHWKRGGLRRDDSWGFPGEVPSRQSEL